MWTSTYSYLQFALKKLNNINELTNKMTKTSHTNISLPRQKASPQEASQDSVHPSFTVFSSNLNTENAENQAFSSAEEAHNMGPEDLYCPAEAPAMSLPPRQLAPLWTETPRSQQNLQEQLEVMGAPRPEEALFRPENLLRLEGGFEDSSEITIKIIKLMDLVHLCMAPEDPKRAPDWDRAYETLEEALALLEVEGQTLSQTQYTQLYSQICFEMSLVAASTTRSDSLDHTHAEISRAEREVKEMLSEDVPSAEQKASLKHTLDLARQALWQGEIENIRQNSEASDAEAMQVYVELGLGDLLGAQSEKEQLKVLVDWRDKVGRTHRKLLATALAGDTPPSRTLLATLQSDFLEQGTGLLLYLEAQIKQKHEALLHDRVPFTLMAKEEKVQGADTAEIKALVKRKKQLVQLMDSLAAVDLSDARAGFGLVGHAFQLDKFHTQTLYSIVNGQFERAKQWDSSYTSHLSSLKNRLERFTSRDRVGKEPNGETYVALYQGFANIEIGRRIDFELSHFAASKGERARANFSSFGLVGDRKLVSPLLQKCKQALGRWENGDIKGILEAQDLFAQIVKSPGYKDYQIDQKWVRGVNLAASVPVIASAGLLSGIARTFVVEFLSEARLVQNARVLAGIGFAVNTGVFWAGHRGIDSSLREEAFFEAGLSLKEKVYQSVEGLMITGVTLGLLGKAQQAYFKESQPLQAAQERAMQAIYAQQVKNPQLIITRERIQAAVQEQLKADPELYWKFFGESFWVEIKALTKVGATEGAYHSIVYDKELNPLKVAQAAWDHSLTPEAALHNLVLASGLRLAHHGMESGQAALRTLAEKSGQRLAKALRPNDLDDTGLMILVTPEGYRVGLNMHKATGARNAKPQAMKSEGGGKNLASVELRQIEIDLNLIRKTRNPIERERLLNRTLKNLCERFDLMEWTEFESLSASELASLQLLLEPYLAPRRLFDLLSLPAYRLVTELSQIRGLFDQYENLANQSLLRQPFRPVPTMVGRLTELVSTKNRDRNRRSILLRRILSTRVEDFDSLRGELTSVLKRAHLELESVTQADSTGVHASAESHRIHQRLTHLRNYSELTPEQQIMLQIAVAAEAAELAYESDALWLVRLDQLFMDRTFCSRVETAIQYYRGEKIDPRGVIIPDALRDRLTTLDAWRRLSLENREIIQLAVVREFARKNQGINEENLEEVFDPYSSKANSPQNLVYHTVIREILELELASDEVHRALYDRLSHQARNALVDVIGSAIHLHARDRGNNLNLAIESYIRQNRPAIFRHLKQVAAKDKGSISGLPIRTLSSTWNNTPYRALVPFEVREIEAGKPEYAKAYGHHVRQVSALDRDFSELFELLCQGPNQFNAETHARWSRLNPEALAELPPHRRWLRLRNQYVYFASLRDRGGYRDISLNMAGQACERIERIARRLFGYGVSEVSLRELSQSERMNSYFQTFNGWSALTPQSRQEVKHACFRRVLGRDLSENEHFDPMLIEWFLSEPSTQRQIAAELQVSVHFYFTLQCLETFEVWGQLNRRDQYQFTTALLSEITQRARDASKNQSDQIASHDIAEYIQSHWTEIYRAITIRSRHKKG